MAWVECDYRKACLVQGANKRVQGRFARFPGSMWAQMDHILALSPFSYGDNTGWVFRYNSADYPTEQKSRPDLFPPRALQLAGEVLAFGETKHPGQPWKQMSTEDHIAATLRHLLEHLSGVSNDAESGKLHLAHSLVRLGMAVEQYITQR